MPTIIIKVTPEEMDALCKKKGWKTWKEFILESAGIPDAGKTKRMDKMAKKLAEDRDKGNEENERRFNI